MKGQTTGNSRRGITLWGIGGVLLLGTLGYLRKVSPELREAMETDEPAESASSVEDLGTYKPPAKITLVATGTGTKGLKEAGVNVQSLPVKSALWAKFKVQGATYFNFGVWDEAGHSWPSHRISMVDGGVVVVPEGYSVRPSKLRLQVFPSRTKGPDGISPEEFSNLPLPPLPKPRLLPPMRTGGDLSGVTASRDRDTGAIRIQAAVAKENILCARTLRTSLTDKLDAVYGSAADKYGLVRAVGDRMGNYLFYPQIHYFNHPQTVYLEVEERVPVRRKFTVRFPAITSEAKFGRRWPKRSEVIVSPAPGFRLRLMNTDDVPVRQPRRPTPMVLYFSTVEGYHGPVRFRLVRPTTIEGLPVVLKQGSFMRADENAPILQESSAASWNGTWQDPIVVEFDAVLFEPRRRAIVAAKLPLHIVKQDVAPMPRSGHSGR